MLTGLAMPHTGYTCVKKSVQSRMVKFRTHSTCDTCNRLFIYQILNHRIPGGGYVLRPINFV
jgi:hypothetical protein